MELDSLFEQESLSIGCWGEDGVWGSGGVQVQSQLWVQVSQQKSAADNLGVAVVDSCPLRAEIFSTDALSPSRHTDHLRVETCSFNTTCDTTTYKYKTYMASKPILIYEC